MNNDLLYADGQTKLGFKSFLDRTQGSLADLKRQQISNDLEFEKQQENMQKRMGETVKATEATGAEALKMMSDVKIPAEDQADHSDYMQWNAGLVDSDWREKFGGREPTEKTGLPVDIAAQEKLYTDLQYYDDILDRESFGVEDSTREQIKAKKNIAEQNLVEAYQTRLGKTPEDAQATVDRVFKFGKQNFLERNMDYAKERYYGEGGFKGAFKGLGKAVWDAMLVLGITIDPLVEMGVEVTNVLKRSDKEIRKNHPKVVGWVKRVNEIKTPDNPDEEQELVVLKRKIDIWTQTLRGEKLLTGPLKAGAKKAAELMHGKQEYSDSLNEFAAGISDNPETQGRIKEYTSMSAILPFMAVEMTALKLTQEAIRLTGTTGVKTWDKVLAWIIPGADPPLLLKTTAKITPTDLDYSSLGIATKNAVEEAAREAGDAIDPSRFSAIAAEAEAAKVAKRAEAKTAQDEARTPPGGGGTAAKVQRNPQQKILDRLDALHKEGRTPTEAVQEVIVEDLSKGDLSSLPTRNAATKIVKQVRSAESSTVADLQAADGLETAVVRAEQADAEDIVIRGEVPGQTAKRDISDDDKIQSMLKTISDIKSTIELRMKGYPTERQVDALYNLREEIARLKEKKANLEAHDAEINPQVRSSSQATPEDREVADNLEAAVVRAEQADAEDIVIRGEVPGQTAKRDISDDDKIQSMLKTISDIKSTIELRMKGYPTERQVDALYNLREEIARLKEKKANLEAHDAEINPQGHSKEATTPPVRTKAEPGESIDLSDWVEVGADGKFILRADPSRPYIATSAEIPATRISLVDGSAIQIRKALVAAEDVYKKEGKGVKIGTQTSSAVETVPGIDIEDFVELGRWFGIPPTKENSKAIYGAYVKRFPPPEGMPTGDYFRSSGQLSHMVEILNRGRIITDNLVTTQGTAFQPEAVNLALWFRSDISDGGVSYQKMVAATESWNRAITGEKNNVVWAPYNQSPHFLDDLNLQGTQKGTKIGVGDPLRGQKTGGEAAVVDMDELSRTGGQVFSKDKGSGGFPFEDGTHATNEPLGVPKLKEGEKELVDKNRTHGAQGEAVLTEKEQLEGISLADQAERVAKQKSDELLQGTRVEPLRGSETPRGPGEKTLKQTEDAAMAERVTGKTPDAPVDMAPGSPTYRPLYSLDGTPEQVRVSHLEKFAGVGATDGVPVLGGRINVFHINGDTIEVLSRETPVGPRGYRDNAVIKGLKDKLHPPEAAVPPAQSNAEVMSENFRTNQLNPMAEHISSLGADPDKMVLFNRSLVIQAGMDEVAATGRMSAETKSILESMDLHIGVETGGKTVEESILAGLENQSNRYKSVFQAQRNQQKVVDTSLADMYINTPDGYKDLFNKAYVDTLKSPELIATRKAYNNLKRELKSLSEACI